MRKNRFRDRVDAGQDLADLLQGYAGRPDVVVLALPRGGVPVAFEVARRLGAPLDLLVARKLGVPWHEELGFGAIADGGGRWLNRSLIDRLGLGPQAIEEVTRKEQAELERRVKAYRGDRPPLDLRDKTVILVDDGLATGATMRAAMQSVQAQQPRRLVVAVPVAPSSTAEELSADCDEVVCPLLPLDFMAVGQWYERFDQTTDAEVRELMSRATPNALSPGRSVDL